MATRKRTAREISDDLKRLATGARGERDQSTLLHELQVYQEELTAQNAALREAQTALEDTRDRFIELYDFAPNGYLTVDRHGIILQINLTGASWFGRSKAAIEGMPLQGFVQRPHRDRVGDYLRRCRDYKSGSVLAVDVSLRTSGTEREVQLLCKPRSSARATREYFMAMIDVTEHRRLEMAREEAARDRAALAGRLISIQEEERHRIARDLHDNIGQQVTGLRLKLDSMAMTASADTLRSHLAEAQVALDRLDRALDFISADLRPAALDLGFVSAVEQFVRDWSVQFGIPAELHVEGLDALQFSPEVGTHLYRMVQEALNNVYKHARAKAVSVILERRSDRLVLIVEDDGVGFAERRDGHMRHRSLGLVGMRERAALIGGSAEVESAPGKGTTVFVQVPNAFPHPSDLRA